MPITRLGAVDYLNARPLVFGLELHNDLFAVRFDPPSKCAALLHEGSIDVGMIPSIEFLRGSEPYAMVPGMGIISRGPVASVALFSAVPPERFGRSRSTPAPGRRQACCRCSVPRRSASIRSSCRCRPKLKPMLARCDAALLIGDPALYLDHAARELRKIDLGDEWTRLTGLPFVWAFWAGRPRALTPRGSRGADHRAGCRRRGVRCDRRRILRPGARRARPGLLERQYPLHPRRAGRSRPSPLLRAGKGARHRRSRGSAGNLLRRVPAAAPRASGAT